MDRAGYYKKSEPKSTKNLESVSNFVSGIDFRIIFVCIIGFLISRVTMLYMMSSSSIAYLALFAFTGSNYYAVLISVVLGMVTISSTTEILKYLLAVAIMTTLNFFIGKKENRLSIQAVCGSASILLAGIIKTLVNGISFYFILMAVLESILVFTLVFVFDKAVARIMDDFPKKYFSNEELISLAILIGGAIVGIGDIHFGNLFIRDCIVILMVMVIGYRAGAVSGTSAGITLGLFMLLSNNFTAEQAVIISGAGLVCGFMQELGKIGSGIGFVMGGLLLSAYVDGSIVDKRIALASIIVFFIFIFIPNKFYENIKTVINFDLNSEDKEYTEKVQSITSEKLNSFSNAFQKLAETFDNLSEKRNTLSQKEVAKLFDEVADKVCSKCGMNTYCWEDYFYSTYQTMFGILSTAETKGHIEIDDIPSDFRDRCVNLKSFISTSNQMFDLYKTNLIWYNKIIDSRKLISEQLKGVSSIISNLSKDIKVEFNFKDELSKTIKAELDKNKIKTDNLIVLKNKFGRYEVSLCCKACYGRKVCSKEILPIINKVLKCKMKSDRTFCSISRVDKVCNLKFVEEQKYKMLSAMSKAIKDGNEVSGDSYTLMEIKEGQCLMALSDGMGSGIKANKESTASIELLEEFLASGFDKDISTKMINSVLVLKSDEESFSTLDMCIIDMYSGIAEFVKIGGAATFIKRNSEVEIIHSTSLPVGILDKVDMEVTKRKLKENDLIVMVTDGVLDSNTDFSNKELWIEKILKDYRGNNPQDIADYILEQAKNNSGGHVQDDMTVLVSRFWERPNSFETNI